MVKAAAAGTRKKMRLTSLKAFRQNSGTKLTRESCFGIRFLPKNCRAASFCFKLKIIFFPSSKPLKHFYSVSILWPRTKRSVVGIALKKTVKKDSNKKARMFEFWSVLWQVVNKLRCGTNDVTAICFAKFLGVTWGHHFLVQLISCQPVTQNLTHVHVWDFRRNQSKTLRSTIIVALLTHQSSTMPNSIYTI